MLVELKQKSQMTIPSALVKKLRLKPGDKLEIVEKEGRLIVTPVAVIPRDQLWFYQKEWQKGEREVEQQIRTGRLNKASTPDELYQDLGLDNL